MFTTKIESTNEQNEKDYQNFTKEFITYNDPSLNRSPPKVISNEEAHSIYLEQLEFHKNK